MERLFQTTFDQVRMPEEKAQDLRARLASPEQEEIKVKKGKFMVRTALAAAVIGALCCAGAGAVRLGLVQAEVFFFSTEEDLAAAAAKDGRLTGVAYYGGADYEQLQSTAEWAALQWEGIPGETLTEERTGGVGDGWTAMRTYHGEEEGEEYGKTLYLGTKLSDFAGLWERGSWDAAWLEERYTPEPDAQIYMTEEGTGREPRRQVMAVGAYRGTDGRAFNLQYSCNSENVWEDQYELSKGYEVSQLYETEDGVTAAVEIARSASGKPVFWVHVFSGHVRIALFGTQMELEEIQTLLDGLKLSALCEYEVK